MRTTYQEPTIKRESIVKGKAKCSHCGGAMKNGVCQKCGYGEKGKKASKKAPFPPKKKGYKYGGTTGSDGRDL